MCEVIGRPELATDPRFADHESLMANSVAAGDASCATRSPADTLDEWRERLADFIGQWAVVQDTLEAAADPQTVANGYVQDCETANGVPFQLVAAPVQFDEEPATPGARRSSTSTATPSSPTSGSTGTPSSTSRSAASSPDQSDAPGDDHARALLATQRAELDPKPCVGRSGTIGALDALYPRKGDAIVRLSHNQGGELWRGTPGPPAASPWPS